MNEYRMKRCNECGAERYPIRIVRLSPDDWRQWQKSAPSELLGLVSLLGLFGGCAVAFYANYLLFGEPLSHNRLWTSAITALIIAMAVWLPILFTCLKKQEVRVKQGTALQIELRKKYCVGDDEACEFVQPESRS